MIPRAEMELYAAQIAATNIASPPTDKTPVRGGEKDAMPGKAAAVIRAEEKLERARAWERVFRRMDRAFPFETSQEGVVAAYLYDNGMTQEEVCLATGCSRTRIRQLRDNWVCHAALFAAADGLIAMKEGEKDG